MNLYNLQINNLQINTNSRNDFKFNTQQNINVKEGVNNKPKMSLDYKLNSMAELRKSIDDNISEYNR